MQIKGTAAITVVAAAILMSGCGSDGLKSKGSDNDKDQDRMEELERTIERQKKELAEEKKKNARLNSNLTATRARLAEQVEALKKEIASQEKTLASLREELAELEASSVGNEEAAARIAELKTKIENLETSIAVLEEEKEKKEELVTNLVGKIEGLWQIDRFEKLKDAGDCSLFLSIQGLDYEKAVVCRTGDGSMPFKSAYENGAFVDIVKVPASDESEGDVDTDRQPIAASTFNTCGDSGFLTKTASVIWSQGTADFIALASGDQVIEGLYRDDPGLGTRSCKDILNRPNRPGLEAAVYACKLFAKEKMEEISASPDVGCFVKQDDHLTWEKRS